MINLAGLKKSEPKSKKEKPSLPDPSGALAALVKQGINADKQEKAWVAASKQTKAQLGEAAMNHAFALYQGQRGELEHTFKVNTPEGGVTISMKNAYKLPEDVAPVRKLLGQHADAYLRKSFQLEIDSEAIPHEMQQRVVDELVALARRLDEEFSMLTLSPVPEAGGPIINAIAVREVTAVDKRFHDERHALFTPEQNLAIQKVMPCQVSCRYEY